MINFKKSKNYREESQKLKYFLFPYAFTFIICIFIIKDNNKFAAKFLELFLELFDR